MNEKNELNEKAFFGKNNCFKLQYNKTKKECYFHFGLKNEKENNWTWNKYKFSDIELGEIISVLEEKKDSTSFYHQWQNENQQLWVSKRKEGFFLKTNKFTKSLNDGEQEVLKVLLKEIIKQANF
ncbi:MAG: hypothetical protein ABH821_02200 [archaeon]